MKSISKKFFLGAATTTLIAAAVLSSTAAYALPLSITAQMDPGARGNNVTGLQQLLATNSTIYPSGIVSGYYGNLTRAAVSQFQSFHNLPMVGRVGPATQAAMNSILATGGSIDISSPTVSNVTVGTAQTSATVSWTTDENARGKVFYSTSMIQTQEASRNFAEPYVSGSVVSSELLGTSQSIAINNLQSNTTYYFAIISTDRTGNVTFYGVNTFMTR